MANLSLNLGKKTSQQDRQTLGSWFDESGLPAKVTLPVKPVSPAADAQDSLRFLMRSSLRQMAGRHTSVPELPASIRFSKQGGDPKSSPLQRVHDILDESSFTSKHLASHHMLQRFLSPDAVMDISMNADGSVSGYIRSVDGYRRLVLCKPDGATSQRVTDPSGRELFRFTCQGEIIESLTDSIPALKPAPSDIGPTAKFVAQPLKQQARSFYE